ncbi:MAG TPA: STAS domain-containing protein [Miltoncostaeaceae bacterium]|jgi:anti-sigma B factor antagonist|nr:STAS domain-containing protein [Miltoncostaeaceae bacterium]
MRGRIEREGDVVRLALLGEFDMAAAGDFAATLADIEATRPRAIVMDLAGLSFMDSTGLHALLGAHERAVGSHVFAVLDGTGPAHRVLVLAGVAALLMVIGELSEIPADASC